MLRRRVPHLDDSVTDFLGKLHFGGAEGFWRVLEGPLGFRLLGGVLDEQLGRVHRDVLHALLVLIEDDAAERRAGGVVQVDDGFLGTAQRLEGTGDQVFTRLGEHLNGGVIRNMAVLNEGTHEVEVGLRSGRERGFDFLHTHLHQGLPEAQFLLRIHRLDQRLVAITQVGAAPDRRGSDGLRRPGTVRQVDGREGAVLLRRVFEHGHGSNPFVCGRDRACRAITR